MPVATSYPGVYVVEDGAVIPTIMAVPTAVAAFVGVAERGPVNQTVHVGSWAEFERQFLPGPLEAGDALGNAVYLFFLNGGSDAEIVRVGGAAGNEGAAAKINLAKGLDLEASSPGTWGNDLSVTVDTTTAVRKGNFNLTVSYAAKGGKPQVVDQVKNISPAGLRAALAGSDHVRVVAGADAAAVPAAKADQSLTGGADAAAPAGGPDDKVAAAPALDLPGDAGTPTGIYALGRANIFNMLCLALADGPAKNVIDAARAYCLEKRAMLILDPPSGWAGVPDYATVSSTPEIQGEGAENAVVYFPNIITTDPDGMGLTPRGPAGAVAGVWARTDRERGVWKAPAGITDGPFAGVTDLAVHLENDDIGQLNPLAVNCLRTVPLIGPVVWGARTLDGADADPSQWKYLPVRRTALFLEESLYRGTQWVVFEPNDEPLWARIRLSVGSFMNTLFRQGAFQGATPKDAYVVKCDKDNNPQNDIDRGIVNILVAFAPLKPAEFVILHIQQLAGQLQI